MRYHFTLALGALMAFGTLGLPVPNPASAQSPYEDGGEVDINTFYEALEPHGRWFEHPQYGYVWSPEVDPDWRPYTRGRWQFTEEHGWYWQAEEPWGWAVFHYGRWFLDDDAGWVWVPGTEWAPAWVAWRNSDEHVGWAPLPPEAEWRGNSLSFSESYYDSPRYHAAWIFAPIVALSAYSVYRYLHPVSRNHLYVRNTRWIPSHRTNGRRIYNAGFDRYRYEALTRRRITPVRIVNVSRPEAHHRATGRFSTQPGVIQSYRPRIVGSIGRTPPPRIGDTPRRDWRHGRPGVTEPPFRRFDDDRSNRDRGRPDPLPSQDRFNSGGGPRPPGPPPQQPQFRDRSRPDPLPSQDRFNSGGGTRPPGPPPQQPQFRDRSRPDPLPAQRRFESGGGPPPVGRPSQGEVPRVQPTPNFNQQPPGGGSRPQPPGGTRGQGPATQPLPSDPPSN